LLRFARNDGEKAGLARASDLSAKVKANNRASQ
jgi:hypothetical protein